MRQRGAPAVVARAFVATILLLAGVAGTATGVAATGRAAAQSGPTITPFPRPIVAFVPADRVTAASAVDPALATQSVGVAPSDGIGRDTSRVVTVGFASPVTLPTSDYRVSVVVGVPGGQQTRASFQAADGAPVGGTVETSTDGRRWTSAGATDATLEDASLQITAPVGTDTGGAGRGLWLDAQIGTDEATRSTSPVFALDALVGSHVAGALPATPTGALADPAAPVSPVAEPLALPGSPPTLTVDEHLTVTETAPVPATLADQPVVNAIDEITFMPGYTPDGTTPAVVQINRFTGVIALLEGTTGLPTDRTGDGSFVVERPTVPPSASSPSPSSPSRVVLDLAAVAEALDLPLDPDGLGLGLRRKVTLADGRDVIGMATMATLVWYETASPTASPGPDQAAPTTEADPGDGSSSSASTGLVIAVAAGLVLLAIVAAGLLVVRRRRGASVDRWLDEYADESGEPPDPPEPGDQPEPEERSPADALASFEAEVSALTERVDRLADRGTDEDEPER